jgi:Tfp pilus assembly protein FimV
MLIPLIGLLVLHAAPAELSERLEQLKNEQRVLDRTLQEKEALARTLPSLQRRAAALGVRVGAPFAPPPEVPAPSATEADPVKYAEQLAFFTRQKIDRLEKILVEIKRLEARIRSSSDARY